MAEPLLPAAVLTAEATLDDTMTLLQTHIPLPDNGYTCRQADLWRISIAAATQQMTIEATCADLVQAPHANTVRGYLTDQWQPTQLATLEQQVNAALLATVPAWLWERDHELAIDTHDEPYYGRHDPQDPQNWICRGEAKAGTTRFYRCATAYVLERDVRLTLALVFVKPGDTMLALLQRLVAYVQAAKLRIRCLYADKGFCTVPVLRYCQEQQLPAIIAVPIRGKHGGTRALCRGQGSRWDTYTVKSSDHGTVTVKVAVVRSYQQRRDGSRKAVWLVFACIHVRDQAVHIRPRYRRRFGIESSYRQVEELRVRTTSPSAGLRLMLLGLAAVLRNVWVALHWRYLRYGGRGPRRVARHLLRLTRFVRFLIHAVEGVYGRRSTVDISAFSPGSASRAGPR